MSEKNTGSDAVDATLDGRVPIAGAPDATPAGMSEATVKATVDQAVSLAITSVREDHSAEIVKLTADSERDRTLACLTTLITGNPGDDVDAMRFRSSVQDLVLQVHQGDKPHAELMTEANRLHENRMKALLEAGGDGGGDLPAVRQESRETDGRFDIGHFMSTLGTEMIRLGDKFEGDQMTGAPELEYASELLEKNEWANRAFSELRGASGPRSRVVPVPAAALRPDMAFAESYGTDAANQRQPTYRRDALVPFFRPVNVLSDLGVPMPMISNDITLPRLSASLAATWETEVAAVAESTITVTPLTTAPKRLAVRDSLSWMLLAGGDSQFGVQPVVVAEMAAAMMQAKEAAVYGPAITNGPTGIRGTTGIGAKDLGSTDPTYGDLLAMITVLSNAHLPVAGGRFLINPTIRELLTMTQKFTTGSSTVLQDLAFREPGSGVASPGSFGSSIMGTIAGHPTAVTTHIPVATGGDTYIYFALWQYVWCLDYAVAFLTIDDVSQAHTGQTRITVNSYHDVAVRFPAAFNVVTHDTSP